MQNSKLAILDKIKSIRIAPVELPDLLLLEEEDENLAAKFSTLLTSIGGEVIAVNDVSEIDDYISTNFTNKKVIKNGADSDKNWLNDDPHTLHDVDFVLIEGKFGVAENGAVWLTDKQMGQRVAPFITQHLGIVLDKNKIVNTMHEAYRLVNEQDYAFGTFLAGPSKTADIEQSLVLGAHGARTLVVFLLN